MKEYAFDIRLWAIARVMAESEAEAQEKLAEANCSSLSLKHDGVSLAEMSVELGSFELFEVDGKPV